VLPRADLYPPPTPQGQATAAAAAASVGANRMLFFPQQRMYIYEDYETNRIEKKKSAPFNLKREPVSLPGISEDE
jgi:hypothetical protein